MRQSERRRPHHRISKENNVDIDGARAFRLRGRAAASHRALDLLHSAQQLARHQSCFKFDSAVDEPRLPRDFHWLGFIKLRRALYRSEFAESFDRSAQISFAV